MTKDTKELAYTLKYWCIEIPYHFRLKTVHLAFLAETSHIKTKTLVSKNWCNPRLHATYIAQSLSQMTANADDKSAL